MNKTIIDSILNRYSEKCDSFLAEGTPFDYKAANSFVESLKSTRDLLTTLRPDLANPARERIDNFIEKINELMNKQEGT